MKNVLEYAKIFIVLIIFFVISLTIAALIPTESIKKNVEKSAAILSEEKEYYEKQYINKIIKCDNYTDAIMINNAFSMDAKEPLYSALIVRRYYIPGVTIEILPEEDGDPTRLVFETDNLTNVVNGDRIIAKEYAKYWHGYLIFLKPLLIIFNYGQLRILQLIILTILTATLIYLIYKKIGILQAIIVLLGLIIVDIQYIYMSLEYTPIFILMLCSSIFLLIKYKKIKDEGKIFFVTGMLTCFFDFLTVPIITLGIPLIIYFLLKQKEQKLSLKETILIILKNSVIWLLGYALTWITKFALVDIIYHKNLIHTALKQVGHRTFDGTSVFELNLIELFKLNFKENNIWIFAVFLIVQIIIGILNKKSHKAKIDKTYLIKILPYLIISMMPIVWYLVLQEHSIRHAFFTYRALSVFWIGIMITISYLNMIEKTEQEKK